jgi:hypothetical protein
VLVQDHVAAGHRHGHGVGAGLDAVWQHLVARTRQRRHALDDDRPRAGTGYPGAHGVEACGEIDHFRLARRIVELRRAMAERRGHHQHVGGAHRDLRKGVMSAANTLGRPRIDVAGIDVDLDAERFQTFDKKVDGPRTDGTAARQRDTRLAGARQQRPDDPEARPHLGHEFIGCSRVDDAACGKIHRA